MDELGYRPNLMARGLVTRATNMIGVVVSGLLNPFYPELLQALAARLDDAKLGMLLIIAGHGEDRTTAQVLQEAHVDAVIASAVLPTSGWLFQLIEWRFPIVLVNRGFIYRSTRW